MSRREKVIELRKQGKKYREIQKELNISQTAISKILKSAGMHKHKTTKKDIDMIKSLALNGFSSSEIGIRFNLAPSTIRGILSKHKTKIHDGMANIRDKIIDMSDNYSIQETADILDLKWSYVQRVRWRDGIPANTAKNRINKATELLESGLSIDDIASKMNLKPQTIMRYFK